MSEENHCLVLYGYTTCLNNKFKLLIKAPVRIFKQKFQIVKDFSKSPLPIYFSAIGNIHDI